MAKFLTADCHFNHPNIIRYEPNSRPFWKENGEPDVDAMNKALAANWNNVVQEDDDVYVVGDFFMGPTGDIVATLESLNLKGKIHLIRGNHDTEERITEFKKYFGNRFCEVSNLEYITVKNKNGRDTFVILCHFPIASADFIENCINDSNKEIVVCYGHIHGKAKKGFSEGTYHVGVDTNDLTPVRLSSMLAECFPNVH